MTPLLGPRMRLATRTAALWTSCRIEEVSMKQLFTPPAALRDAEAIQSAQPHHASGQHNLRKAFTPAKG